MLDRKMTEPAMAEKSNLTSMIIDGYQKGLTPEQMIVHFLENTTYYAMIYFIEKMDKSLSLETAIRNEVFQTCHSQTYYDIGRLKGRASIQYKYQTRTEAAATLYAQQQAEAECKKQADTDAMAEKTDRLLLQIPEAIPSVKCLVDAITRTLREGASPQAIKAVRGRYTNGTIKDIPQDKRRGFLNALFLVPVLGP